MIDNIELIKSISSLLWPIILLIVVYMFRKEIRILLLSLLPRKKESGDTLGYTPPKTPTPASLTSEFDDLLSHTMTDDVTPVNQLIVKAYKNINSDEYFVILDENPDKIHAIAPDGNIDWFQKKLFHMTIEDIGVDLFTEEQREKFYWWIQTTEPVASNSRNIKKQPISGYLQSYMRMLKNPNTEPSRMLRYIKSRGKASWSETKDYLHDIYGYELTSGSMGASLKALETLNLVTISGQGEDKIITISPKN